MKNLAYLLLSFSCLLTSHFAFSQTTLQGIISEVDTDETFPFAIVELYQNGIAIIDVVTDIDGNYIFENLTAGTYDVETSYGGYQAQRITRVIVKDNTANHLDIKLESNVYRPTFTQTTLQGKITEADTGIPVLFGPVALYQNNVAITDVETDIDGNYIFENLKAGTYDVEASYVGLKTQRVSGVIVKEHTANNLNIILGSMKLTCHIYMPSYKIPVYEADNFSSGFTFSSEQIRRSSH